MSIIARPRPPVKPTRRSPKPTRPFGEGIFPDRQRFEPSDEDRAWHAQTSNKNAQDFDVVEGPELEWPGTPEEFDRWLDSIAPTDDELEHLARCEAFLGHDA
jgi:hypothetical protein